MFLPTGTYKVSKMRKFGVLGHFFQLVLVSPFFYKLIENLASSGSCGVFSYNFPSYLE